MLEEHEMDKILGFLYNIYDNLDSMSNEIYNNQKPSVRYIKEKIKPALLDMIALNEIIKKMD